MSCLDDPFRSPSNGPLERLGFAARPRPLNGGVRCDVHQQRCLTHGKPKPVLEDLV
jgi:hypothetical protein